MSCDHSAFHSGMTRYTPDTRELQMVLVCDECGAERAHLGAVDYLPNPRLLIGQLAELTARRLGLAEGHAARVRFAALVCAMGRELTPRDILDKGGPLSEQEWQEVRRQPELAAAELGPAAGMTDIREWVLCHRERPDGGGYPRALVDGQIPRESRILGVVEAYMAMTSERPYRATRDHADACRELARCGGAQFDAEVVDAFIRASHERDPQPALAA